PKPRITPPPHSVSLGVSSMDDLDELPRANSRLPMYIAAGLAAVALVGGAVWMLRGRGGGDAGRTHDQYAQGRNLFLLDTEDAFHQAEELLQQAHGADANNAMILAALGELDATWAGYLRDEARDIEAKTGAAGEV